MRLSRNALAVSWPWIGDDSSRMLPGSEVLGSYEHYTLIERVCGQIQDMVMYDSIVCDLVDCRETIEF